MNAWQIIQRQNKSALATGSVTAAIPAYVEPTITAFRAHHVNDDPELGAGEHASGLIGSTVWFYFEVTDPDRLIYGYEIDSGGVYTQAYAVEDLIKLGSGFLFSYIYADEGEYTPDLWINWKDADNGEHSSRLSVTNPPVDISSVEAQISPSDCMVGDPVTLAYNFPEEIDSAVVEWGDE